MMNHTESGRELAVEPSKPLPAIVNIITASFGIEKSNEMHR